MAEPPAIVELGRIVAASGLAPRHSEGVVLVSGGADSACMAAGLRQHLGVESIQALHVNYGLRPDSDRDEARARELCASLRINLHIERPRLEAGNMQAAAREARYRLAEVLRERMAGRWIATGHTRTDLAETFIYRLASSPGARALLGLPERNGYVIRPLLAIGRTEVRRLATEAKLPFADDPSNEDPRFARNRIRAEILPLMRGLSGEVERNIAITRGELAEEAEALDEVVAVTLERLGTQPDRGGGIVVEVAGLATLGPGLRRLVLRELARRESGMPLALGTRRAAEIWHLAEVTRSGELDLGGGLRVLVEQGRIRFICDADRPQPAPVRLTVPGEVDFGQTRISAEIVPTPAEPGGPESAMLDIDRVGTVVIIRGWRPGDRMRPLGLGGSRTLQDLFVDRKVPRSQRRSVPIVVVGGEIAWVAGVAIGEDFRIRPSTREAVLLRQGRGAAAAITASDPG